MTELDETDVSFEEMLQHRLGPESAGPFQQPRMKHPFWTSQQGAPVPPRTPPANYLDDCHIKPISARLEVLEQDAAALIQTAGSFEADIRQIKRLHRKFVWKYHPDRLDDFEIRDRANVVLGEVNAAVDAALKSRLG